MKTESTQNPDIKKIADLIQGIEIAMLTTADPDGVLRSRPMAAQQIEFDGDLWFFTQKSSGKMNSIAEEHQVNVSFADARGHKYVSIAGRAQMVEDEAKARELWKPIYKAWFPRGLEDPDLVLLKVSAEMAEYWDSPGSTVVKILTFARALLSQSDAPPSLGHHEKVQLNH